MPYQAIENYAIIGNMRSAALVGLNGSIDWFCFPHFDSPSVFASILDENKGGYFRISPTDSESKNKQYYWPDTNVLITRFYNSEGIVEIVDYMPVGKDIVDEYDYRIVRRVRGIHGGWFKNTIDYWRNWLCKSSYKGRWREIVNRSTLISSAYNLDRALG